MRSIFGWKVFLVGLALVFACCVDVEAKPKPKPKPGIAPKGGSPRQARGGRSSSVGTDGGDYVTEKRGDTTYKYKKKTSYDFEGLGVEAMADKPTGAYISNIKDVKAKSLVQIRKDFDAEVIETTRQMP